MSKITAYKVIQADGNRALAAEVQRFIDEGWEPHGSVYVCREFYPSQGAIGAAPVNHMFQPIVKREPESAELKRLREMEAWISGIVEQLDNPCTNELGMLTFAHEKLEAALRGGPHERKTG